MAVLDFGFTSFVIPEGYARMKPMPQDSDGSVVFGTDTDMAQGYFIIFTLDFHEAMPFDNDQVVIDSIHHYLNSNQGLIEVNSGTTQLGRRFVYSIIKTVMPQQGVQYSVTLQIEYDDCIINLQGPFSEVGTIGIRDATIYEMIQRENKDKIAWMQDPYDSSFENEILMNYSEQRRFDQAFPTHPLSQARQAIDFIIENN